MSNAAGDNVLLAT